MSVWGNLTLRVCMIPANFAPWSVWDGHRASHVTGLIPDVIRWLSEDIGFEYSWVPWDVIPIFNGSKSMLGHSAQTIADGVCDVCWTTVDQEADMSASMPHTIPFYTMYYSTLVQKSFKAANGWGVFQPFTEELWLATVLTTVLIAITIALIRAAKSSEPSFIKLSFNSLYHSSAALLQDDDMEWNGWQAKWARLVTIFFSLIITASYTASLTAYFTDRTLTRTGPVSRADLAAKTSCVGNVVQQAQVVSLLGATVLPPAAVQGAGPPSFWPWCKDKVASGEASSIVGAYPELQIFMMANGGCSTLSFAPRLKLLAPSHIYFNVRPQSMTSDSSKAISNALSQGLARLFRNQYYANLLELHFYNQQVCQNELESEDAEQAARLKFSHLSGAFWITYAGLGIAIVGAGAERFKKSLNPEQNNHNSEPALDGQTSNGDDEVYGGGGDITPADRALSVFEAPNPPL